MWRTGIAVGEERGSLITPDRVIVHLQKSCLLGGSLSVNLPTRNGSVPNGSDSVQLRPLPEL